MVLLVVVVVAVVVAGLTVSLFVRSTHSQGTGGSPSPASAPLTVYRQALAATRASKGCHYVAVTSGGGGTQQIVGDAGPNDGKQVITLDSSYGSEQFTLLLSKGTVYFRGNVPALQDQVGVAARAAPGLSGRWITVVKGDGPYNVLAPGITLNDQAAEMGLEPSSTAVVTERDGTKAMRISGAVPPQNGAPAGTGHLDIAVATQLPITYVSSFGTSSVSVTSTTAYSAWGTAPSFSVPAGAVAWSSLGASQPPGGYGGGGSGGPTATPTPLTV